MQTPIDYFCSKLTRLSGLGRRSEFDLLSDPKCVVDLWSGWDGASVPVYRGMALPPPWILPGYGYRQSDCQRHDRLDPPSAAQACPSGIIAPIQEFVAVLPSQPMPRSNVVASDNNKPDGTHVGSDRRGRRSALRSVVRCGKPGRRTAPPFWRQGQGGSFPRYRIAPENGRNVDPGGKSLRSSIPAPHAVGLDERSRMNGPTTDDIKIKPGKLLHGTGPLTFTWLVRTKRVTIGAGSVTFLSGPDICPSCLSPVPTSR